MFLDTDTDWPSWYCFALRLNDIKVIKPEKSRNSPLHYCLVGSNLVVVCGKMLDKCNTEKKANRYKARYTVLNWYLEDTK